MPSRKLADKYQLAVEEAVKENPSGGLNGFEQEWNLLDEDLRPLLTVGAGPSRHSFVDYLRAECIPPWQAQFSQLEVFHWMIEWATRPYFSPRGAIYEARLMEATLLNALHRAGINCRSRSRPGGTWREEGGAGAAERSLRVRSRRLDSVWTQFALSCGR